MSSDRGIMRILTTLFTAALAAFAGLSSSGAAGIDPDAATSCKPHTTAWTWPLDRATAQESEKSGKTVEPRLHNAPAPVPAPTSRFAVTPRSLPTPTSRLAAATGATAGPRPVPAQRPTPVPRPTPAPGPAVAPLPTSAPPTPTPTATNPTILRPFEPPRHRWDAGHRGVDLAGYVGEPVVAANSGTVLYAGFLVDRPVVVVGHGLLRTTYEPVLADALIRVGVQVRRGQRLGILLPGHCVGSVCLHWGLVSGRGHADVYYDPLLLLGCGAVRLEPDDPSGSAGNPVGAAPRTG